MAFDSLQYGLFLIAVVTVFLRMQGRPGSYLPGLLLCASVVFYAFAGFLSLGLFAASIILNQRLMEAIHASEKRRRTWMTLGVLYNLCYLFAFKYAALFYGLWGSAGALLGLWQPSGRVIEVLLPIGISFYTFESLSILTDIYRRRYPPPSLADHALFVSFFPHLIAGPIMRGSDLLPQLRRLRSGQSPALWGRAAAFLTLGLFKKVVIADTLAAYSDTVFALPASFGASQAWLAAYAFAFQIYFDFSGYSDMAEGSAALFGLRLVPNFREPYAAVSLTDFWHRWHVSLSTWLRDYLYIPLGGSRHGAARTYAALFVTMLLGGLWHGASLTFVAWGAFHGLALALERATGATRPTGALGWRRLAVFHVVLLGWVIFRSPDAAAMATWCASAFHGAWALGAAEWALIPLLCFAWAFSRWESAWERGAWDASEDRLPAWCLAAFQVVSLFFLLAHSSWARPFIYFRF